jgi:alkanesulfonate monooxygenase SsuD/methylene tetrahydromethanopterin reductase-like flavin-dependent oxidoreductase (luciferase family)
MACIPVVAADTDEEAEFLASSVRLRFLDVRRGIKDSFLPPPVEDLDSRISRDEQFLIETMLRELVIGGPRKLANGLAAFVERTRVDELMVSCNVYDHGARLKSYGLVADAMRSLVPAGAGAAR